MFVRYITSVFSKQTLSSVSDVTDVVVKFRNLLVEIFSGTFSFFFISDLSKTPESTRCLLRCAASLLFVLLFLLLINIW